MRLLLASLVTAAALLAPAVAHATAMDTFTVTGSDLALSFSLPASPTVDGYAPGIFFYVGDLSFTENGQLHKDSAVYFYDKDFDGGFELTDAFGTTIDDLSFASDQLFTGSLDKPTFKLATFALTPISCEDEVESFAATKSNVDDPCHASLRISSSASSATPEPGSLALLGTGALGVVGVLRRRLTK